MITEVYHRIFISDGETACNKQVINDHRITAIVCVALEFKARHGEIASMLGNKAISYCGMHDEFIGYARNTDDQIRAAVEALKQAYESYHTVLVHCKAGHNRSVATVVGYLVASGRFRTVQEAYDQVRNRHECDLQPLLKQHLEQLFNT